MKLEKYQLKLKLVLVKDLQAANRLGDTCEPNTALRHGKSKEVNILFAAKTLIINTIIRLVNAELNELGEAKVIEEYRLEQRFYNGNRVGIEESLFEIFEDEFFHGPVC